MIMEIADTDITVHTEAYNEDIVVHDIVVIAVDSMNTRYRIEEMLRAKYPQTHIVDGRMGGGQIEVHSMSVQDWKKSLCEDADTDPCSARYISYTSYIIAGMIANTIKRLLKNEDVHTSTYLHTNTMDILKK